MINRRLYVPLALLVAAALACTPSLPASTTLYKDNFSSSSSGWCQRSSDTSNVDYAGGQYVFKVKQANWIVWCPYDQSFSDIHVEVTATDVGKTGDTVFGVICNDQKSANATAEDFYYMGITGDGHYTMTLYKDGKDKVLAEDKSSAIPSHAISYTVGADCAGGNLALYVNGAKIASASDSTYTSGNVGLFVWTGDKSPAEIHYDDIAVTKLSSATPTP